MAHSDKCLGAVDDQIPRADLGLVPEFKPTGVHCLSGIDMRERRPLRRYQLGDRRAQVPIGEWRAQNREHRQPEPLPEMLETGHHRRCGGAQQQYAPLELALGNKLQRLR